MKRGLFGRHERQVPGLNTASLPDLIFTVLFFFMIVTHMRTDELHVRYHLPQGTELEKIAHKSSVCYIYIGRVADDRQEDPPRFFIQLNNRLATIDDIRQFVENERSRMGDEDRPRMTVSIKADRDVPMGLISDVKRELQQAFALRVNYSADEKAQK